MADNNRFPESARKAILDALEDDDMEASIRPTLPLVGSLNVNINNEEEMQCE